MDDSADSLEALWNNLLSRQSDLVRQAFSSLVAGERQAVLAHMKRMRDEPGWQPEQRESARVALQTLEKEGE